MKQKENVSVSSYALIQPLLKNVQQFPGKNFLNYYTNTFPVQISYLKNSPETLSEPATQNSACATMSDIKTLVTAETERISLSNCKTKGECLYRKQI